MTSTMKRSSPARAISGQGEGVGAGDPVGSVATRDASDPAGAVAPVGVDGCSAVAGIPGGAGSSEAIATPKAMNMPQSSHRQRQPRFIDQIPVQRNRQSRNPVCA